MSEIPVFKFALREDLKDDKRFLPTRGEDKATGWDVRAAFSDTPKILIYPLEQVKIPLGVRGFCPDGWWYEIRPRSSSFAKKNLHALYGVVDETYEGELIFACQYIPPMIRDNNYLATYYDYLKQGLEINFGDAIGQIIPVKRQEMNVMEITNPILEAEYTNRKGQRGAGGFGPQENEMKSNTQNAVFPRDQIPAEEPDYDQYFPEYDFHPDEDVELSKLNSKKTEHYQIDLSSVSGRGNVGIDLAGMITPEQEEQLSKLYEENPDIGAVNLLKGKGSQAYRPAEAWIQTYSGRRFNPTNPVVDAIVIQDIAHALSMQCRFSGHVKKFYSVAQHCVNVSYICNQEDALWGLMHDASEAYLVDIPSPLKRTGYFDAYKGLETQMQKAICQRFGLPEKEPPSVKRADIILLATEARDLMSPLHSDWVQPCEPLPFKIEPLSQQDAKNLFMKRFFELNGDSDGTSDLYEHYLRTEGK